MSDVFNCIGTGSSLSLQIVSLVKLVMAGFSFLMLHLFLDWSDQ